MFSFSNVWRQLPVLEKRRLVQGDRQLGSLKNREKSIYFAYYLSLIKFRLISILEFNLSYSLEFNCNEFEFRSFPRIQLQST